MAESLRILIFEDEPDHLELFLTYLEMTSYATAFVSHVQSMAEGKQLLQTEPFDVLFLDLSLDDSSVTETLAEIRFIRKSGA